MIGRTRSAILVAVLMVVTCGIYGIYWQFVTTDELQKASGDESLSPVKDLLLGFVTCGLWSIFVLYRNAEIIAQTKRRYGVNAQSKGTIILVMVLIAVFNGITALVGPVILQDELNGLWKLMQQQSQGTLPSANLPQTF